MSNEHTPTTLEIRKAFINLDGDKNRADRLEGDE